MFNSNQPRDPKSGEWTSGPASEKIRKALDWIRSVDAKKVIKKVATEDNAKAAVTWGIQNALFHMSHAEDPIADAFIEHQVNAVANHLRVTKGHARNLMISTIRKIREARK